MQVSSPSLRQKLILLITAVTSVTVLMACAGLGAYQWHHARNTLFEQEYTAAQITADSSAAALLFGDDTSATETLEALRNDSRILSACLFNKSGQLAASFTSQKDQNRSCPPTAPVAGTFTLRHLSVLRPVAIKGSLVGVLLLEVSLSELNRLTVSLLETGLLATLCASLFALLLSSITERWVSRPIVKLTQTAVKISQGGNRSLRAERTSNDEVGLLIDQFNSMLDRLHEREAELQGAHDLLEGKVRERTQTLQDEISERKLVELDLSHAKDLAEQANRAKSSFLANMSHELRTPLNAIIGYSEMLYEDAQDPSQETVRDDLGKILSSARHLVAVISDILDLSKIEAGQMKVQLEELPVSLTVNDVLPIAEGLVKNSKNTLLVHDGATGVKAIVDALRFRQCLLNLISNACKFTTDGTITFSTALREKSGTQWVVWNVQDTGIGIAAESLPNLFRSFSQVDASATRRHGGTGLGLCISQELCRAMGGWIEVHSELGVGSSFQIWLPAAPNSMARDAVEDAWNDSTPAYL